MIVPASLKWFCINKCCFLFTFFTDSLRGRRRRGGKKEKKRAREAREGRGRCPPPLPKLLRSFWPFPSPSTACHTGYYWYHFNLFGDDTGLKRRVKINVLSINILSISAQRQVSRDPSWLQDLGLEITRTQKIICVRLRLKLYKIFF